MSAARAPSVAAAEAREPVLQFAFAKSLPYRTRMTWVLSLIGVGILLQVAFLSALPGAPLVLAAVLLSWVVGFDNRLDRRGLAVETAWESVPFEKVGDVVRIDASMTKWDQSAFDVSNGLGCGMLFVAAVGLAGATAIVGAAGGPGVAAIVAFDGAALLLLQWFSGMRTLQRRPDLVLKAKHLADVVARVRKRIDAAGTLKAQMRMEGPPDARSPEDVRLVVAFSAKEDHLLLVQGQVVLNRVQGRPYPYFYAVVVASRTDGLVKALPALGSPPSWTVEPKSEKDVDIVVVRQKTTKTSGYHTSVDVSARILDDALILAGRFAERSR